MTRLKTMAAALALAVVACSAATAEAQQRRPTTSGGEWGDAASAFLEGMFRGHQERRAREAAAAAAEREARRAEDWAKAQQGEQGEQAPECAPMDPQLMAWAQEKSPQMFAALLRKIEQCAADARAERDRARNEAAEESRRERELRETAEAMVGIADDLGVELSLESAMNWARLGMVPPQLRQR